MKGISRSLLSGNSLAGPDENNFILVTTDMEAKKQTLNFCIKSCSLSSLNATHGMDYVFT